MRSTIAKQITDKTSPATKAKVKAYAESRIEVESMITQPSLFGFQKPRFKLPPHVKAELKIQVLKAKELFYAGNQKQAAAHLHKALEGLEAFERSIASKS